MVAGEIREWSLVRTGDGYYGIVTSVRERYVFLANGCEQKFDEDEWNDLEHLPLNIFQGDGNAAASFIGIERSCLFDQEQRQNHVGRVPNRDEENNCRLDA